MLIDFCPREASRNSVSIRRVLRKLLPWPHMSPLLPCLPTLLPIEKQKAWAEANAKAKEGPLLQSVQTAFQGTNQSGE